MPFHRPIPDSKQRSGLSSGIGGLIEAEKLMQVAFVLPASVCVGWLAGWWVGNHLHQKWIEVAGVIFGCVSGLVYVIRMAIATEKKTTMGDEDQNGAGKGNTQQQTMSQDTHPIVDLTNEDLDAMLKRAFHKTLILGAIGALMVLIGAGWRSGAMLLVGALISAASILEWQRLVRLINARLDKQKTPASAAMVVVFFVLRLTVFAAVIYVSLKCFHGSVAALLCGLCLAVLTIGWETIRLLRD